MLPYAARSFCSVQEGISTEERLQVREVTVEGEGPAARATGVRLADGRVFRGRAIVSNATRWDTFDGLLPPERLPEPERLFRRGAATCEAALVAVLLAPCAHITLLPFP